MPSQGLGQVRYSNLIYLPILPTGMDCDRTPTQEVCKEMKSGWTPLLDLSLANLYHGELFVNPGNGKHYKRASASDLAALLKAAQGAKDETAPYYEAQLVHYGLQRTKDKARAKWRLLEAINGKILKTPEAVLNVEKELKKEYKAANRKANTATSQAAGGNTAAAPMGRTTGEAGAASKKRKNQEDSTTAGRVAKKPRIVKETAPAIHPAASNGAPKTGKSSATTPKFAMKQTARSQKLTEAWHASGGTLGQGPVRPEAQGRSTKQVKEGEMKPSAKKPGKANARNEQNIPPTASSSTQKSIKRSNTPHGVKQEPKAKQQVKAKREPKIKQELDVKSEPNSLGPANLDLKNTEAQQQELDDIEEYGFSSLEEYAWDAWDSDAV